MYITYNSIQLKLYAKLFGLIYTRIIEIEYERKRHNIIDKNEINKH